MQHDSQLASARQPDGTYDYGPCFRHVAPMIQQADAAFVNLETTLAGPPHKGYPIFSTPEAYPAALDTLGFDVITLANNHTLDRGRAGLLRTLTQMDSLQLIHLGTYRNAEDRNQRHPLLYTVKGMRLALLNYTYGNNETASPAPAICNTLITTGSRVDTALVKADMALARNMNADFIVVLVHWGLEYQLQPSAWQRGVFQLLRDEGAHLIIGSHPHVIQPVEWFTTTRGDSGLVAYSLGNFMSGQRHPNTDGGGILEVSLSRETDGKPRITGAGYRLVWVNSIEPYEGRRIFSMVDVQRLESGDSTIVFSPGMQTKCAKYAADMRSHLKTSSPGIRELPNPWLNRSTQP